MCLLHICKLLLQHTVDLHLYTVRRVGVIESMSVASALLAYLSNLSISLSTINFLMLPQCIVTILAIQSFITYTTLFNSIPLIYTTLFHTIPFIFILYHTTYCPLKSCITEIHFTHLKLCLATATHNFKWVKTPHNLNQNICKYY